MLQPSRNRGHGVAAPTKPEQVPPLILTPYVPPITRDDLKAQQKREGGFPLWPFLLLFLATGIPLFMAAGVMYQIGLNRQALWIVLSWLALPPLLWPLYQAALRDAVMQRLGVKQTFIVTTSKETFRLRLSPTDHSALTVAVEYARGQKHDTLIRYGAWAMNASDITEVKPLEQES